MSETTETTEVETTEVETTEAPVEKRVPTGDPMRDAILDSIESLTNEANAKATEIGAATTDRTKLVHDILTDENTEDEKVRKFQQWRDALLAKLDEEETKAREYVASTLASANDATPEKVDALKVEHKALKDKVQTAIKFYISTLPGTSEDDLKGIPALKSLRGGTAKGGNGSKRPRVQRISVKENAGDNWTAVEKSGKNAKGEDVVTTNFTVLAAELHKRSGAKVEVKELQAAAFAAAGTDDLNSLDGKVFEFAYTAGENNYFVQVQPKSDSDE